MRIVWHAVLSLSRGMLPSRVVSSSNELDAMDIKEQCFHV